MGKYYGYFRDVNDRLYVVDIENKQIQGEQEITLADPPFTTTMDSDGDNIYASIKTQGATVRIAQEANDYYFDIYAGDALGTKVSLFSGDENNPRQILEWVGYATPCMYDQGINTYIEPLEIECVDPISVLKDIPYRTNIKEVATFKEIIGKCLGVSNQFKHLYISKNVQLEYGKTDSVIEILKCSENNFFEKKTDKWQEDDDLAWNAYDVLYQVIQYLGYVCYCEADKVYIMDYDAIINGDNVYYHYTFNGKELSSNYVSVSLTANKEIEGQDHNTSNETISLDEVYNKVIVKDEFNTYDDPEDSELEENITGIYDPLIDDQIGSKDLNCKYPFGCTFERDERDGGNVQIFVCQHWGKPKENGLVTEYPSIRTCICVAKFYKKPNYKFYHYSKISGLRRSIDDMQEFNIWNNMLKFNGEENNINGAYYVYFYKKYVDEEYGNWERLHENKWKSYTKQQKWDAFRDLMMFNPEKVGLNPLWIMVNPPKNHIEYNECETYPFFNYTSDDEAYVLGGTDSYIIISGQIAYHDEPLTPIPLNEADAAKCSKEGDYKYAGEIFIYASFRWGNQWWDGANGKWVDSKCTFPLRWMKPPYDKEKRGELQNHDLYIKWHDFLDTAEANGIDGNGCYIPAPTEGNLEGGIEFQVYANYDMNGQTNHGSKKNLRNRYYSYVLNMQNFKLKIYKGNGLLNDRDFTDTIYTNYPETEGLRSMDEITFKICTYDDKSNNHSSVTATINGKNQFIQELVNCALYKEQVNSGTMDGKMCQEYQFVYKLVRQYQEPRIILDYDVMGINYPLYTIFTNVTFTDKTYLIKEIEKDYRYQRSEIKLVEKV